MTATTNNTQSKRLKTLKPKSNKTFLEVNKFLFNEFITTYNFWILFNIFQALVLFCLAPYISRTILHYTKPCMAQDVDENGKPYGFQILKSEPEDGWCPFLPTGWKLPKTLFFVLFSANAINVQLGINFFWMIVYKLEHPFLEQYKIEPQLAWPWNKNREEWMKKFWVALKQVAFNNTVIGILGHIPMLWYYELQYPMLDISEENIPGPMTLAKQLMIIIMWDDFIFAVTHRLLHCRHKYLPLYQWLHKQHHEFSQTISLCATYCHPLEFYISDYIPFFFGSMYLGGATHFTTFSLWMVLRFSETADAHSGYEFPWNVFRIMPFSGDCKYHFFHHFKNRGNYCTWFKIWDTLWNTNIDYVIYEELKAEKKAEEIQEMQQ